MEMASFFTIPVLTPHLESPAIQVRVAGDEQGVRAGNVLHAVCDELGILGKNIQYFCLTDGRFRPRRKWKSDDVLPYPFPELCIKKWVFLSEDERNLLEDEGSLRLLYQEARSEIDSGKLCPTQDQKSKLEEFLDPGFTLLNQYIFLCHKIPDYWSVVIEACTSCHSHDGYIPIIPVDIVVDLYVNRDGLDLREGTQKGLVCWNKIKSWTTDSEMKEMEFLIPRDDREQCSICLRTEQAHFLLSSMSEILKTIQTDDSLFYTSMVDKNREDKRITWQNALYDPTSSNKTFFGFKSEAYVDLGSGNWLYKMN